MKNGLRLFTSVIALTVFYIISSPVSAKLGFGLMPKDSVFPSLITRADAQFSRYYVAEAEVVNGNVELNLTIDAPEKAVIVALGEPELALSAFSPLSGKQAIPAYSFRGESIKSILQDKAFAGFYNLSVLQPGMITIKATGIRTNKKVLTFLVKQPMSSLSLKTYDWPVVIKKGEIIPIKAKLDGTMPPMLAKLEAVLPNGDIIAFQSESNTQFTASIDSSVYQKNHLPIKIIATGFTGDWSAFKREENITVNVVDDHSQFENDIDVSADLSLYIPILAQPGKYKIEAIYGRNNESLLWAQKIFRSQGEPMTIQIPAPMIEGHEHLVSQVDKVMLKLINLEQDAVVDKTLQKIHPVELTL